MTPVTPQQARRQMSLCGQQHIPFLFAFDFEMRRAIFIPRPLEQHEVLFRTPLGGNSQSSGQQSNTRITAHPISYETYQQRFATVSHGLHRGDSFLTNLTVRTPIECGLSLREIFNTAHSPYCLLMPEEFVCFSPEIFVRITGNTLSTYPMKGTIDASIPNAAQTILNDPKETAEHTTVVDLLRNDLGMNASSVEVKRFRYIDTIDTPQRKILQVSSEIQGTLPENWHSHLGEIVCDMLPAGSVSGAPKQSTLRLIKRAEGTPRGFYCGVFGYYDGKNLDSAVLIRYIEQAGNQLFFHSGGGITVNSDCHSEYEEVIAKIYLHTT